MTQVPGGTGEETRLPPASSFMAEVLAIQQRHERREAGLADVLTLALLRFEAGDVAGVRELQQQIQKWHHHYEEHDFAAAQLPHLAALVSCYVARKQWSKALFYCDEILSVCPGDGAWLARKLEILRVLGRASAVVPMADRYLSHYGPDSAVSLQLALAYLEMGQVVAGRQAASVAHAGAHGRLKHQAYAAVAVAEHLAAGAHVAAPGERA